MRWLFLVSADLSDYCEGDFSRLLRIRAAKVVGTVALVSSLILSALAPTILSTVYSRVSLFLIIDTISWRKCFWWFLAR